MRVALTIGAVTPGLLSIQASATWIGSTPFASRDLDDAIDDVVVGVGVIQAVAVPVVLLAQRCASSRRACGCRRGSRAPAGSTE